MTFSHPIFLFLFLPVVIVLYSLLDRKFRCYYLLFVSLIYYAYGETIYIVFILISTIFNYGFSLLVDRYRLPIASILIIGSTVIFNIGLLACLKYPEIQLGLLRHFPLAIDSNILQPKSIHTPIGISFLTFQAIAYVIDVYTEKSKVQRNPLAFALFMTFFPKIAAGPIIRYREMEQDICEPSLKMDDLVSGVKRFIIGLGKKLLVADVLSKAAEPIFSIPSGELTAGLAWLGIVCYTLQIYFDFSGYSDMAIGLARMFGFHFEENFNYPYISRSVTEFWRRWHISLSSWLRDYLFLPLSYALITNRVRLKMQQGQYKIPYRSLYSLFIVFAVCGLWHGSTLNFIIWGMFHGLVLIIESVYLGKVLKRSLAPLSHAYTLLTIMISWILFRTKSLPEAFGYIKSLAGFSSSSGLRYNCGMYLNNELILTILIGIVGCYPLWAKLSSKLEVSGPMHSSPAFTNITLAFAEVSCISSILMLSLMTIANTTHRSFIYFNF